MNQRRKVLSRGTALVDPRAAVERLRSFQLAEPLLYVLEVVRAAVAGGATAVDLYNDSDDLVLSFDGAAPSADDLTHLLDHLFSATNPRLRLLAIAVNTALGSGPRHVDLYTTHDAPAGQCHRVRFTAGVAHDPDARVPAALERARAELVARPADLPPEGVRVHLRESFGMPVVREWFTRDPAETVLLRERLVALPIPLRRDGVALPTGFAPPALVQVELDLGAELRGSLQLLPPSAPHRLALSELGVILEQRPLTAAGDLPLPLRLHLDARSLPTNASRSQVDLSGGLQHTLRRAWNLHLPALLAAAAARLADPALPAPERVALHESLAAWALHCVGDAWPTLGRRALGGADEAELGDAPAAVARALFELPLVPGADGALRSLAALVDAPERPSLAHRGADPVAPELAPFLDAVLWLPPKRPRLEALLAPLSLRSAADAVARAAEALTRRQRFLGLTPREPRLPAADDAVLRAALGDPATDESPALPVSLDGLRGELLVRARGVEAPGALQVTVFVEQRPLPPEELGTAPLPLAAALEHPTLRADPMLRGVVRGAAVDAVVRATLRALAEGLAVAVDALSGALSVQDPRRQWLGPALDDLTPDARRALARAALEALRGATDDVHAARPLAAELLARHPALAELPLWPTTAGAYASTADAIAMVRSPVGCVLVCAPGHRGERADGRPVLRLDEAARRALAVALPADRVFDVTATLPTRVTPDPRALLEIDDRRAVPWILVTSEHTRVAIAPSPSTKETFALAHHGAVVEQRKRRGRFGPMQVAVEDDRLVTVPGWAKPLADSVPPDLDALVDAAERALVDAVARARRGDPEALDALGGDEAPLRAPPARRLLLSALVALGAELDDTPMIPLRRPDGSVHDLTPRAFRELLPAGGDPTYPFLAEAPSGLEGDAFAPVICSDREHRGLIERAFAVKLRSAHEQLPALRTARARRAARARLGGRPAVRADDLAGFATGSSARSLALSGVGHLHAAVAREADTKRVEVIVDDVVAFELTGAALRLPLVGRFVPDGDDALAVTLDGLSDAGRQGYEALARAIVPVLLEAALDDVARGARPAAGLAALCLRWAPLEGPKGLALHADLLARLRRVPMWPTPSGELTSLVALTLFSARPAWCRERAAPWITAEAGEDPDVAAVVLHPDDAKGLGALVGELAVERTEEIERDQRRRTLRATGATAVRCQGEPACPVLSARIEALAPKLGYGELRVVEGEAALTLRVHAPGSKAHVVSLAAPFALAAALACPDLDAADVDASVRSLELGTRLLEAARALLLRVAATREALPAWSDAALRWALLTSREVKGAALGREAFADTEGRPLTLGDLAAQEAAHRAVTFVSVKPAEPCALPEAGVRAVVLDPREVWWLQTLRKGRDGTPALKVALAALAWDRSPPAAQIAPAPDAAVTVRERRAFAGGVGEVWWLDSAAPARSTVTWYRGRRRLGESVVELPWPARVALEAPSLTPDATRTAPLVDLAFSQERQRAIDLALGTLAALLGPGEGVAPLGSVAAHDPKSPSWHGGVARVVGWLWLVREGDPGSLRVMAGERPATVSARVGGKHAGAAPVTGRLWLHRSAGRVDGDARNELLDDVVAWAWRRLLDQWAGARGVDLDDPTHALHLARAALAGLLTGAAMRDAAKTLRLPGTRTTFAQLQTARKEGRALRVVPPGDARLSRAYFVPAVRAPWLALLDAEEMLENDAAPAPEASAPKPAPKPTVEAKTAPKPAPKAVVEAKPAAPKPAVEAKPAAPKVSAAREVAWPWAARVEAELRALGLPAECLHALEGTEAARGARDAVVDYDASTRVARVAVRHPVAARWLTGDPRRGATLLAMAAFGVIARARADVTKGEELAAMDAVLAALAARR